MDNTQKSPSIYTEFVFYLFSRCTYVDDYDDDDDERAFCWVNIQYRLIQFLLFDFG
jgi:hypothetical protein